MRIFFCLFLLGCSFSVIAQDDSSRLDAGYVRLRKDLTQAITIKGSDLEKIPFANLSEAISAWAYGGYTPAMVQYIVDGSPVSDVNVYPIYEIDEIVVLENAAALAGTGGGQQEVVLVRTKHPKGINVAAQTGLVNANSHGASTDTRLYHQYYASASRELNKVKMGVSANYLRDVFPLADPYGKISTPYDLQRWRFNGYFTWKPDSHNQLDLTLNYTTQRLAAGLDSTAPSTSEFYTYSGSAPQHLVIPQLRWRSGFGKGWSNELRAEYLNGGYSEKDVLQSTGATSSTSNIGFSEAIGGDRSIHLWARDRLAYLFVAGDWRIEPALTASYEHMREEYWYAGESVYYYTSGGGAATQPPPFDTVATSPITTTYNEVFVTPALDISFRKTFDLVGGVVQNVSQRMLYNGPRAFPFASASVDLLRLGGASRAGSLKLFGSYARTTLFSISGYGLSDLSRGLDVSPGFVIPLVFSPLVNSPVYGAAGGYNPLPIPTYWVFATGATYSGWGGRLQVSYSLERRNFTTAAVADSIVSSGGNVTIQTSYPTETEWRSTLHHADVRVMVLQGKGFSWQTGLNVTLLRSKVDSANNRTIIKNSIGDTYPNPFSYTGGWVNRVQVGSFTGGLDLLGHFGETLVDASGGTYKLNSMVVPNLYVGYRCAVRGLRAPEVFVAMRGLVRNSTSDLMDGRRYYTVGGKVGL